MPPATAPAGAATATWWFDVSDVIAALALALSILALLLPWFRRRKAGISARLEHFPKNEAGRSSTGLRVVVVNYGPADAKDIFIEIRAEEQPVPSNMIHGAHSLKTPVLHATEEHHIELLHHFQEPYPDCARVTWQDGRPRRQERDIWLSLRTL